MVSFDKDFPFIHFLSDEEVFSRAFEEATNEERQFTELTAPDLVRKYQEAKVAGDEAKCVLIDHYLRLRLISLQVRATSRAGWLTLIGAILSGLIGFALGKLPYYW